MGVRQYLVKDYKDAIDSLTKSYNINQVDTTIISIGDIFYELKKYDKALEWYKKAGRAEIALWKSGLTYEAMVRPHGIGLLLGVRYNIYSDYISNAQSCYDDILKQNDKNSNAWFRAGLLEEQYDVGDSENWQKIIVIQQ